MMESKKFISLFAIFFIFTILAIVGVPPETLVANSGWETSLVATPGPNWTGGMIFDIAVDDMATPHISYNYAGDYLLYYAHLNNGAWDHTLIDNSGGVGFSSGVTAGYNDIAVDGDGFPHLSYKGAPGDAPIQAATLNTSGWHYDTVTGTDDRDNHIALAPTFPYTPTISFVQHRTASGSAVRDMKAARWDGSGWVIDVVESAGDVGGGNDIALSPTYPYTPHVSYNNLSDKQIKYAAWDGTSWQVETVDSFSLFAVATSIAVDQDGRPHVCYSTGDAAEASQIKYAYKDIGGQWQIETIGSGINCSMAMGTDNRPRFTYFDPTNNDLIFQQKVGTTWQIEIAASDTEGGRLALDSQNNPHIVYFQNGNVMYATKENLPPEVDAGPDQVVSYGEPVKFAGSFTAPDANDTHIINWDFGDGVTHSGSITPTYIYAGPGVFTATLSVTDNAGAVGTDTTVVTVTPLQEPCPSQVVFIDNFAGSDLNMAIWHTFSPSNGHYSVNDGNNGLLEIFSGTNAGGGFIILSDEYYSDRLFSGLSDQLVLQTRITAERRLGDEWGFTGQNHDGDISFFSGLNDIPDLVAYFKQRDGDPTSIYDLSIDPTTWHDYRIEYERDATRYYVDGVLVVSQLAGVVQDNPMQIRLGSFSTGTDTVLSVDYVVLTSTTNCLPEAVDDTASTLEDTAVTINVLDNDADPNSDPLTILSTTAPANGAAAINLDNTITYTPALNFNGVDSFTYTISDGNDGSATATVTVTVTPVNDPPTIGSDQGSVVVAEGQTAANSGAVSDIDSAGVVLSASVGTATDNGDNTWSWSFETQDGPAESQTVTITADDGQDTSQTSFTLTVQNVAPTPDAGPDQTVFRNELVTLAGSWDDPAAAFDNPYAWSWDLDGDGLPDDSGTASFGETITRSTNFVVDGFATLTFVVTDKDGESNSDTVVIEVINRAPVADNQDVLTSEDTPVNITLTGSDLDGDSLTFSLLGSPDNGVLSGTPPNLTYTPNADFNGSDSFTFKVNDGLADSNEATVNIIVSPVNDPPVAIDDTATTDEDTAVVIDVQDNDNAGPADEDQTLTTTAVTNPPNGVAAINPDGTITYTPALDFNGIDEFDYTVCDSDDACATATVTVLIAMVNDPPVAADDNITTAEDTPVTIDVAANDSDVDDNLDPNSATELSLPANGGLVNNGDGTFVYTPGPDFNGSDSFIYEICDTDAVCDNATVDITITPVNDAPVCTNAVPSSDTLWPPNHQFEPITISGVTDVEGDLITITITGIFQDEPVDSNGDGSHTPDGLGIGTDTAQVRVERQGGGNGRYYHISFTASDGNGGTCSGVVLVSVPKSQGKNGAAIDDGPLYDSTIP